MPRTPGSETTRDSTNPMLSSFFSSAPISSTRTPTGSLPIRGDVDLTSVNECTTKGLELLEAGKVLPAGTTLLSPDTNQQVNDLMAEFWASETMTAADAQARYVEIIASAE